MQLLPYLPKYNAYTFPLKQVFVSIYFEQFIFLLSAFYCLFLTSEYRTVPEVNKLISGSTQPSTWLQLNKLLMKLWKGVSREHLRCFSEANLEMTVRITEVLSFAGTSSN
jgi:hypothetical protein